MKKIFYLCLLLLVFAGCSKKDELSNNTVTGKQRNVSTDVRSAFSLDLPFPLQDSLVFNVAAYFSLESSLDPLWEQIDTATVWGPSAFLNSYMEIDDMNVYTDGLRLQVDNFYGTHSFDGDNLYSSLSYFESNYQRLHIYIPAGSSAHQNYNADNNTIYIVNALYNDALRCTNSDSYVACYRIQNGDIEIDNTEIDEEFALTHCVFVLSFREYIENWDHFQKGVQSLSNPILYNFVDLVGFSCETLQEAKHVSESYYSRTKKKGEWKFKWGAHAQGGDCASSIGICIIYILPEVTVNEVPWDDKTAIVSIYEDTCTQFIYVENNILGLDLEGADFYVDEMILEDEESNIIIPSQTCHYDVEHNAYKFEVQYE